MSRETQCCTSKLISGRGATAPSTRDHGRMIFLAGDGGMFNWRRTLSREITNSFPSTCLSVRDFGPMNRTVYSCFPRPESLRTTQSPGRGSGE